MKRKATTDLNHTNWDKEDEEYATNKRPNSTSVQSPPKGFSSDYQNQPNFNTSNTLINSTPVMSNNPVVPNSNQLSDETDLKTKRSKHFLSEIAELNRDLVDWLNATLKEKPEALLTRVFLDHQRHVQKLFDEERKLDLTAEQIRILDNQEKVLHMLVERKGDDVYKSSLRTNNSTPISNGPQFSTPVTSNGTIHKINSTVSSGFMTTTNNQHSNTSRRNSEESVDSPKSFQYGSLNSFGAVPNAKKPEEKSPFAGFFSNASQSNNSTSALNNGIINRHEKMVNPFFVSQPTSVAQINAGNVPSTFSSSSGSTTSEKGEEEVDEDQPPKVEVTPVVEEGAVYTKRCKVFMKKESGDGYDDHGVGNLFLKPVPDTSKTQLIVRSDTNLGNVIVNVILSVDLPVKKLNATNAMVVCVPMPGATLRTVLVRVKTSADCEELVAKLSQYKDANR